MPISRPACLALAALGCAALAACRAQPDNAVLAKAEAQQARDAAESGRIACALNGARLFRLDCSIDRISSADGEIIVVGRADAGFRRLRVTKDGRGIIAADGALPARVSIIDDGLIEVAIDQDRYQLPATTSGS